MKQSILAFLFLFSVSVLAVLGPREKAEGGGKKGSPRTSKPVYGTPSANPHIPSVHQGLPVTSGPDFHLPANLGGPIVPKIPGGPVFSLPRDSGGQTFYRPQLPKGTKILSAMEFHHNVSTALLKEPTTKLYVKNSLTKFQPQAMLIKNNMHKHYVQGQWFAPNWWLNHHFVYPYWHYFHYYHLHPHWWWWQVPDWIVCNSWVVYPWADPFYYDCGINVVYRDNYVYVNGVLVASAPDYAYQAYQLAAVVPPPPEQKIEWLVLGVYSLASSRGDPDPDLVLQLAVTKKGLISGTLYNRITDITVAVAGRVEPQTQRVAIQLSDKGDLVMDTGFYNLTLPHTCVYMHFGISEMQTWLTQTWFLVRMDPLPIE
jgi:hypothetical protein